MKKEHPLFISLEEFKLQESIKEKMSTPYEQILHPHVRWIMDILNNPPKPIKKDGLWVKDSDRYLMIVEYQNGKPVRQRQLTKQLLESLTK